MSSSADCPLMYSRVIALDLSCAYYWPIVLMALDCTKRHIHVVYINTPECASCIDPVLVSLCGEALAYRQRLKLSNHV